MSNAKTACDDDGEDAVYQKFIATNMPILDAVMALQKCGYDWREAERMVFEWVDLLEEPPDEGANV